MKWTLAALLALSAASCSDLVNTKSDPAVEKASYQHQMYTPDTVPWKDGPPSLRPGAKQAILEGDPTKPGYFCIRLRFPDGYIVSPHWHPNWERVTMISGTLQLGQGSTFDKANTTTYPAGSYWFMEPGMRHFAWAKGETVLQLQTNGPWAINYVNPADDPRKSSSEPTPSPK